MLEYAGYLTAPAHSSRRTTRSPSLAACLGASEIADRTVESLTNVRGYVNLTFIGEGDKLARVPVPLPVLPAMQEALAGRSSGPLLRTRTGAGMARRSVHRYVARTAPVAGIGRPIGPHARRRTVEITLTSYDISGDALERHASHQLAGFLAGWSASP